MSRVKIVATIGPATDNEDSLIQMRQAGMDVARLNGSHGDFDWHKRTIELLRRTVPDVPILLDLPGAKIRTSNVEKEIPVGAGQRVILSPFQGDPSLPKVLVDYPELPNSVNVGDAIVMDDGSMVLVVDDIVSSEVVCHAKNAGNIRNGQGVHLSGANNRQGPVSNKDKQLIAFAVKQAVDFVGVSFVETANDVHAVREIIGTGDTQIVCKIETQESLVNLQELLEISDALLIDRGDLSVETRPETVALRQKDVLLEAGRTAVPVIVATEILQSMVDHPMPTKAEISDITNLVLDGAAALMLSGETAVGNFPVEAVGLMRRVSDEASQSIHGSLEPLGGSPGESVPHAIGEAIALICRHLEVTKIVSITISGYAARMVAAKKPRQPIIAVSNDPVAARRFNLLRGVKGVHADLPFSRTNLDHIPKCLEALWRNGELVDEDLILVTAVGYPMSGNRMNLIETHRVADLKASLGWN